MNPTVLLQSVNGKLQINCSVCKIRILCSVHYFISLSTLKCACHFIAQSFTAGVTVMVLLQVLTITYCPRCSKAAFTSTLSSSHCSLPLTLVLYEHGEGTNLYRMSFVTSGHTDNLFLPSLFPLKQLSIYGSIFS